MVVGQRIYTICVNYENTFTIQSAIVTKIDKAYFYLDKPLLRSYRHALNHINIMEFSHLFRAYMGIADDLEKGLQLIRKSIKERTEKLNLSLAIIDNKIEYLYKTQDISKIKEYEVGSLLS